MAIRHVLLIAGTIGALSILRQFFKPLTQRSNWHLWLFSSFFLWLIYHYFYLPTNVEEQLYELTGDWIRTLLASIIGLTGGLVLINNQNNKSSPFIRDVFVIALSGTVAIYLGRYLVEVFDTGVFLHRDFYMAPYLGKTPMVVFGSLFLCGIFARQTIKLDAPSRSGSYVWTALASTAVGLTFYLSNTKNGILVLIFVLLIFALRVARKNLHFKTIEKVILAGMVIAVTSIVAIHIESNPAWLNFFADVKAGHDIEKNQNWKNSEKYPLPINERGQTANGSTFERSAWATAGVILVRENPFGYGLINHSFGALALEKWPDFYKPIGKYRHASHSGWLDFTLGFGLPGLIMVLLPMWVCFTRALKENGFWYEFVCWSVPVITLVYTVTEVCTGHFIEFLFFYVALIIGITMQKKET